MGEIVLYGGNVEMGKDNLQKIKKKSSQKVNQFDKFKNGRINLNLEIQLNSNSKSIRGLKMTGMDGGFVSGPLLSTFIYF